MNIHPKNPPTNHNALLFFLKANEIQLVKFGVCYVKYEFTNWENEFKILLFSAVPSTFNSVAKLNNNFNTEYQGIGLFEYTATLTGSSLMCIQMNEWIFHDLIMLLVKLCLMNSLVLQLQSIY